MYSNLNCSILSGNKQGIQGFFLIWSTSIFEGDTRILHLMGCITTTMANDRTALPLWTATSSSTTLLLLPLIPVGWFLQQQLIFHGTIPKNRSITSFVWPRTDTALFGIWPPFPQIRHPLLQKNHALTVHPLHHLIGHGNISWYLLQNRIQKLKDWLPVFPKIFRKRFMIALKNRNAFTFSFPSTETTWSFSQQQSPANKFAFRNWYPLGTA